MRHIFWHDKKNLSSYDWYFYSAIEVTDNAFYLSTEKFPLFLFQ